MSIKLLAFIFATLLIGWLLLEFLCRSMPKDSAEKYSYSSYLNGKHWKRTRRKKLKESPKCEHCGTKNDLCIHHLTYKRNGKSILYKEQLSDLKTLCRRCHSRLHVKLRKSL